MTPTRRYYTHISSTSFGQTLSLPAAIVPGQMSVENLYQRASPRSYVLMAVEWEGGGGGGMLPAMWSEGRVGSRVATADAPGASFYTEGFYNRAGTYTPNTSTAGDAPTEIQALRETHWDWGRVTHPRKLYI